VAKWEKGKKTSALVGHRRRRGEKGHALPLLRFSRAEGGNTARPRSLDFKGKKEGFLLFAARVERKMQLFVNGGRERGLF